MSGRPYPEAFKVRMVQRMLSPGGPTATDISRETNIPQVTLSRWRRAATSVGDMARKHRDPPPEASGESELPARSTREWAPAEKLRVITAAAALKDEELGEFLRREGLHLAQLEEWRDEVLTALGAAPARRKDPDGAKVRELERELARKDKALAEVTALLVLRKKLDALFGPSAEEGDPTDRKPDKK